MCRYALRTLIVFLMAASFMTVGGSNVARAESMIIWNGIVIDPQSINSWNQEGLSLFQNYIASSPRPTEPEAEARWWIELADHIPETKALIVKSAPGLDWLPRVLDLGRDSQGNRIAIYASDLVFPFSFLNLLHKDIFAGVPVSLTHEPYRARLKPFVPKPRSIVYSKVLLAKIEALGRVAGAHPATAGFGADMFLALLKAGDSAYAVTGGEVDSPSKNVSKKIAEVISQGSWLLEKSGSLQSALLSELVYARDVELRSHFVEAARASYEAVVHSRQGAEWYRKLFFRLINDLPRHLESIDSNPAVEVDFVLAVYKLFEHVHKIGELNSKSGLVRLNYTGHVEPERLSRLRAAVDANLGKFATHFDQLSERGQARLLEIARDNAFGPSEGMTALLQRLAKSPDEKAARNARIKLVAGGDRESLEWLKDYLRRGHAEREGAGSKSMADERWEDVSSHALVALSKARNFDRGVLDLIALFLRDSRGASSLNHVLYSIIRDHKLDDPAIVEQLRKQLRLDHNVLAPQALECLVQLAKASAADYLAFVEVLAKNGRLDYDMALARASFREFLGKNKRNVLNEAALKVFFSKKRYLKRSLVADLVAIELLERGVADPVAMARVTTLSDAVLSELAGASHAEFYSRISSSVNSTQMSAMLKEEAKRLRELASNGTRVLASLKAINAALGEEPAVVGICEATLMGGKPQ